MDLSSVVSITVTAGSPSMLTHYGFIESALRIGYGPRAQDERQAFGWLGGLGFSGRRKARRRRLWQVAQDIAERIGHGAEPEPLEIVPDMLCVPVSCAEYARKIFGESTVTDREEEHDRRRT